MENNLTSTIQPQKHSKLYWVFVDSWVLTKRSLSHIFKNMDQLLGMIVQPIMFLLLFRYVFGGAIATGSTSYVNFLVAGILIQMAAFGGTMTAFSVASDLQKGIIERLKSLPTFSAGVMMGHVTADLVRNIVSSTIMILVGLLVGFRPTASPVEWLIIIGVLVVFTFAMSWLSAILALIAKSVEAVQWMSFLIVFPFTFASSAFVPTEGMPKLLRIFAENQPITHVIETMRSLMVGTPMGNHGVLAVVWCLAIAIVAIPIAAYLFRNSN